MLAYFGAKDVAIYEGVASLWFDNTASVAAFRDYERALLAVNAEAGAAFYDPAQSFFVYATEVPIYERFEGWTQSTAGARSWADLPAQAIKYIRRSEELTNCPVALVSTSPEREDTILVRDPFLD